jgi:hypothetical protein
MTTGRTRALLPLLLLALAAAARADPLAKDAQRCLAAIDEKSLALAKILGKEQARCLRERGLDLSDETLEDCFVADPKGKVARAAAKLAAKLAKLCTDAPPPFGNYDGAAVEQVVRGAEAVRIHDLFGGRLELFFPDGDPDTARQRCREDFSAQAQRCFETILAVVAACKKQALRDRASPAMTADDLVARCLGDSPGGGLPGMSDPKGKIARECLDDLAAEQSLTCEGQDLGAAFPGCAGRPLTQCADEAAYCRACRTFAAAGGLPLDCDRFDDGDLNGTCDVPCTTENEAIACADAFPNATADCVNDRCDFDACEDGFCDPIEGLDYLGCFLPLTEQEACDEVGGLPSVQGDDPSTSPVGSPLTFYGSDGFWIDVVESNTTACEPLCVRVDLVPAPGTDYDLELYCDQCGAAPAFTSSNPGDAPEVAHLGWFENCSIVNGDDLGTDASRRILIRVVHRSANSCAPWSLTVTGDACGAGGVCPTR